MQLRPVFQDWETLEFPKLIKSIGYIDSPFPDCPACQAKRPHAAGLRLWPTLNVLQSLVFAVVLFRIVSQSLTLPPICLAAAVAVCGFLVFLFHQGLKMRLERAQRLRMHMALDAPKRTPERLARVTCLMAEDAIAALTDEHNVLLSAMMSMDHLLQRAQQYQYDLRVRLEDRTSDHLTDVLAATARLYGYRQDLTVYHTNLIRYLKDRYLKATGAYVICLRMGMDQKAKLIAEHMEACEFGSYFFDEMKSVLLGIKIAALRHDPVPALKTCFKPTVPDFTAAEQALRDYLAALPRLPNPDLPHSAD